MNNIEVTGTTDTPDFAVATGARSVHLKTSFHAFVNGTDGNTYLQPVEASFLSTRLVCQGKVKATRGRKAKSSISKFTWITGGSKTSSR